MPVCARISLFLRCDSKSFLVTSLLRSETWSLAPTQFSCNINGNFSLNIFGEDGRIFDTEFEVRQTDLYKLFRSFRRKFPLMAEGCLGQVCFVEAPHIEFTEQWAIVKGFVLRVVKLLSPLLENCAHALRFKKKNDKRKQHPRPCSLSRCAGLQLYDLFILCKGLNVTCCVLSGRILWLFSLCCGHGTNNRKETYDTNGNERNIQPFQNDVKLSKLCVDHKHPKCRSNCLRRFSFQVAPDVGFVGWVGSAHQKAVGFSCGLGLNNQTHTFSRYDIAWLVWQR